MYLASLVGSWGSDAGSSREQTRWSARLCTRDVDVYTNGANTRRISLQDGGVREITGLAIRCRRQVVVYVCLILVFILVAVKIPGPDVGMPNLTTRPPCLHSGSPSSPLAGS